MITYHFVVAQKQLEEESFLNTYKRQYFLDKGKKERFPWPYMMPFSCPLPDWSSRQITNYFPSECILSLHDDVIVRHSRCLLTQGLLLEQGLQLEIQNSRVDSTDHSYKVYGQKEKTSLRCWDI